jgi:hypothetical protein
MAVASDQCITWQNSHVLPDRFGYELMLECFISVGSLSDHFDDVQVVLCRSYMIWQLAI